MEFKNNNIHKLVNLMPKKEINPDNEILDLVEEYFKEREKTYHDYENNEDYFPLEESKPPHY